MPTQQIDWINTISSVMLVIFMYGIVKLISDTELHSNNPPLSGYYIKQNDIPWYDIEPGIKWVVKAFIDRGYKTTGSCEGHPEVYYAAYIALTVDSVEALRKFRAIGRQYFEHEITTQTGSSFTKPFNECKAQIIIKPRRRHVTIILWPPEYVDDGRPMTDEEKKNAIARVQEGQRQVMIEWEQGTLTTKRIIKDWSKVRDSYFNWILELVDKS